MVISETQVLMPLWPFFQIKPLPITTYMDATDALTATHNTAYISHKTLRCFIMSHHIVIFSVLSVAK